MVDWICCFGLVAAQGTMVGVHAPEDLSIFFLFCFVFEETFLPQGS
jgi:hypothetical protein